MRFFLPPSGLGLEPGSPCPVIWARSPGPAHTLQLTQATPVGSGLRHGYSGSDCRGPSSQADGASSGPGPFPPTQSIQPLLSDPLSPSIWTSLRSVFFSSGPRGCPIRCPSTVTPPSWALSPLAPAPVVCVDSPSWKARGDLPHGKDWGGCAP